MSYPWEGAAKPLSRGRLLAAADELNVEVTVIKAVWMAEAAGKYFNFDGSLIRRFEPHKMPGATTSWRDSLPIKTATRERMFVAAYADRPSSTLNATSYGAPQIMGFNHVSAGFTSATSMVVAMADAADNHVSAFVNLVDDWGLTTALRAKDWVAFTGPYNGRGQIATYSAIIERNYRSLTGAASPVVLREGSRGTAVKDLQKLLGIIADSSFGPWTKFNVVSFQRDRGLVADGIVGAKTWAELRVKEPPVKRLGWCS